MVRRRVLVSGRVQGVGFRYFVQDAAQGEGLTGWVRNDAGGAVEIEAQGTQAAMERFLAEVRQGPSLSRVDDMRVTEEPMRPGEQGFEITH
jgi:acylphosphatase